MEATQKTTTLSESTFGKLFDNWITLHEEKPSEACPWFELDDCDDGLESFSLGFWTESEGFLRLDVERDELELTVVSRVRFLGENEGTPDVWLLSESLEIVIDGLAKATGFTTVHKFESDV